MSRIVIDARESGTSTGRYIDKLIQYISKLDTEDQIIILTHAERLKFFAETAPGLLIVETPFKEFTFSEQIGFLRQLNGLEADLVHFGMTQQPILYRRKHVTTVHDLTTVRYTNPDRNIVVFRLKQLVYRFVIKRVAHSSAGIMTPSVFVANDLSKFARVPVSKITVTHEAADHIDSPATPFPNLQNKEFIMYVGRPMAHKNLGRLIEAFALLQKEQPTLYLILAGKLDANYARHQAFVEQKQISNVIFTNFITDEQLRWLYENCKAYVFPSLSEGFGLPALEAMIHGAPVISSNATCLPEIEGQAAHYFNPKDVTDIAAKIGEVLNNPMLRKDLIERGYKQVASYSWQRMAEQTLDVYRKNLLGLNYSKH